MAFDAQGLAMQDWALTVDKFIDHAARWHGETEIVSRDARGAISRTTWRELRLLSKRISNALLAGDVALGDRVATLAMNGAAHLAAWFGIMGIGAVCHTLNPRLSGEQLEYIIKHAEDQIIFADIEFEQLITEIAARCPSVRKIVWLDGRGSDSLEFFVASHGADCPWGQFDENCPAGLCYTSGTTGNPKGVVYTHRSNYLHTLMVLQPDVFGLGARDVWLPVVPMFHANAWGLTYATAAVGAKLVLPGRHLDGESLFQLMHAEGVTKSAGVPTVWQGLLQYMDDSGRKLDLLDQVMIGGAACSRALLEEFATRDITVQHNWGMTETSPLGTAGSLTSPAQELSIERQLEQRLKQGRVPSGVDMRIVDEFGNPLAHDGSTPGLLQVRGHSVVNSYYRSEESVLNSEGYFDTGDVATIDPLGYVKITDRAKDVIKSGGEWISSVDMENAALMHPDVELAAVIAIPDLKWGERPLMLIKPRTNALVNELELRTILAAQFAKWELPDRIVSVTSIPLGATGKIDKKQLREMHAGNRLDEVRPDQVDG